MEQARIEIQGMSCGHCVAAVRQALGGVPGVQVDSVEIGSARVRYDRAAVRPEQLAAVVAEEGYPARLSGETGQ